MYAFFKNRSCRSLTSSLDATLIVAGAASGFEASDYVQYSYMAHGGSLVADETLVPGEIITLVGAKEREILDGLFRVNVIDAASASDKSGLKCR